MEPLAAMKEKAWLRLAHVEIVDGLPFKDVDGGEREERQGKRLVIFKVGDREERYGKRK